MKKFLSALLKWSAFIQFPLYLLLPYAPGAILSAILFLHSFGPWANLALLTTELLEIKILHDNADTISIAFISLIILHPNLGAFIHIINQLLFRINVSISTGLSDDILLRVRIGYVIVAFLIIAIRGVVRIHKH